MKHPFALLASLVAFNLACSEQPQPEASAVKFLTFGNVPGLSAKLKQEKLSICLTGAPGADVELWKKNIASVALSWIEPLRNRSPDALVSQIEVLQAPSTGSECDADVAIVPGVHSNTSIGLHPRISMDQKGYFASYNVLAHEFGHAFGLSDTYQGGQSGNCKPGQPQGLMCNTSFDKPQDDDVAGMNAVFAVTFGANGGSSVNGSGSGSGSGSASGGSTDVQINPRPSEPERPVQPTQPVVDSQNHVDPQPAVDANAQPINVIAHGNEPVTPSVTVDEAEDKATASIETATTLGADDTSTAACSCAPDKSGNLCMVYRGKTTIAYSPKDADDQTCKRACNPKTGRFRFVLQERCGG